MKDIKYIKEYYNKHYTDNLNSYWDKTKILNAFKTYENDTRQVKWLSKRMGIKGNETILDAGCGIGGTMKQIALLHPDTNVYGVNVSDGQIKMAEQVLEGLDNCNLSVQDYTNTNFEDNSFDVIYFCESICYNEYGKVLTEVYRILKPNGTLYIIDIVDNIGGFELISNKRFIKPSIHWINAVRNSSLKQYHNARTSSIPPVRGADFIYKKTCN